MFANNQLSEFVSATAATTEFQTFSERVALNPVRLSVAEKYRFRRIYLAIWFRGDLLTEAAFRVSLDFLKNGSVMGRHEFGRWSASHSPDANTPAMPPFSVEIVPTADVAANPPMLAGGDMSRQLIVTDPTFDDEYDDNTFFVRITPWETLVECDEIRLGGYCFAVASAPEGHCAPKLFLGCHSSIANQ